MDPQLCEEMNTDEFKFCFVMLNIERYINFIVDKHGVENEPNDGKKEKEDWIGLIEDIDYVVSFS